MVSDDDLVRQLEAITASIDGVREDMAYEGHKRDRRIKTNQRALLAAILAACLGIFVGSLGIKEERAAQRRTNAARVASCKQYNLQQAVQIGAEIDQSHDLVAALAKGVVDPVERKRAVTRYNKSHDALIRSEHMQRDCTAEGIRLYLGGK